MLKYYIQGNSITSSATPSKLFLMIFALLVSSDSESSNESETYNEDEDEDSIEESVSVRLFNSSAHSSSLSSA